MNNSYKVYASKEYVDSKVFGNISVPATASVGQTIVVKSVDANGKPTEWEAVDMSIITDSSGAKWKLVVGTDGTLSTTAVTE